ncbi:hypothetical protein MPTK1_5g06740 [Marchantia polymorpha subsp. ruderalis]|uniref:Uncharacterized protein n=2 Tax=Marchantia polymorpha TaxID=3197 RepID=A0AAF6BFP1_MARPO|nr:hypothetical protein MARPO_0171s0009 [Marchantia polymorpha]BBN10825.1 hypothetical protein Mp_5g06740 [Marchantia polymorpha subsp. ruderalis]|eukprot:PTQ28167.1 hypothetical protein MARPO_0171s0009 [Marchantia polymorpha]
MDTTAHARPSSPMAAQTTILIDGSFGISPPSSSISAREGIRGCCPGLEIDSWQKVCSLGTLPSMQDCLGRRSSSGKEGGCARSSSLLRAARGFGLALEQVVVRRRRQPSDCQP